MSRVRSRVVGAVLTTAMAGALLGAGAVDDASAKRGPTSFKKADKRGDSSDTRRGARAAGRKVG